MAEIGNESEGDVTELLQAWQQGDREAVSKLLPLVYENLHVIAKRLFERERLDHTLQPTAVISELYMRLAHERRVGWESRADFFAFSASLIRNILVDHTRRRDTLKRGAGALAVDLGEVELVAGQQDAWLVDLDDALQDLASLDPRGARIVELRFFAGLTNEEIAKALDVARATVKRDWQHARRWLSRALRGLGTPQEPGMVVESRGASFDVLLVWDPEAIGVSDFSNIVGAIGDVARESGAIGVKRLVQNLDKNDERPSHAHSSGDSSSLSLDDFEAATDGLPPA